MCCLGSFCLADLSVDKKSVTAVAVCSTNISLSILCNTHTSAHFALFPEAFLFSSFKAERQEKVPTGSQKQNSEETHFNRFICIALLEICGSDFSFLHHLNEVPLSHIKI